MKKKVLEKAEWKKQKLAKKEKKKAKKLRLIEEKQRKKEEDKLFVKEKREIEKAIEDVKKQKFVGLRKVFKKKKEELPKEIPEIGIEIPLKEKAIPKIPKPKKKFNALEFIKHRIYDARDALAELDLERARHIYVEIMHSYSKLRDKDKAKVYEDIKELYDDRKHAEAMFK